MSRPKSIIDKVREWARDDAGEFMASEMYLAFPHIKHYTLRSALTRLLERGILARVWKVKQTGDTGGGGAWIYAFKKPALWPGRGAHRWGAAVGFFG